MFAMNASALLPVWVVGLAAAGFSHAGARAQLPTNFTAVTTHIYASNSIAPGYLFLASCAKEGEPGALLLADHE